MANTICKFMSDDVRGSGRLLSYSLESTKCDLNWKPSLKEAGRSMVEQAEEVANVNHNIANNLRGGAAKPSDGPIITDPKNAATAVMESANDLADALAGLQDTDLDRIIELPFGKFPAKTAAGIANANMLYHWGQVNYMEVLDGDKEFRIPPEFINN